jgi:hypothetical protein
MRKPDAAFATDAKPTPQRREHASCELVCLALILALATLLWRIASVW